MSREVHGNHYWPSRIRSCHCRNGKSVGDSHVGSDFSHCLLPSKNPGEIINAINTYTQQVTILAPSAWDSKIRLDPPKNLPSLEDRLKQQQLVVEKSITIPSHTSVNITHNLGPNQGVISTENGTVGSEGDAGGSGNREDDHDHNLRTRDTRNRKTSEFEDVQSLNGASMDENPELLRTGRLFGGLILDVKRKIPWLKSDFTDALHMQTVASVIYIYLATITKAITFGGFLGDITDGQQGVLESFLGHALAGGMFCLLGGQPLTVLGCTGPVLIFEKILVGFCSGQGVDYLTFRLWVGLWTSLLCTVIVALDLSFIIQYFTRFSEESFAALIGIIFIVESLKKLFAMSEDFKVNVGFDLAMITVRDESCRCEPTFQGILSSEFLQNATDTDQLAMTSLSELLNKTLNEATTLDSNYIPWEQLTVPQCHALKGTLVGHGCPYVADVFFFSVILFFGTFTVAMFLKKFKITPYFPNMVRTLLSDYAVIIAILVFVGLDVAVDLDTPKLIVPTVFMPTRSDTRGWIIPFTREDDPWYLYLGAFIPALLLTILIFMDQQITSVIVNRSEHKLKKGAGYHLDMLVVGIMMGVCSVFGLPWCAAATVLCLGHVDSLKMETKTSAPGEMPQFLGVREQRVTGVLVFILTGLSVKLAPILKFIPMPVLYGILMYMGIASLRGMQFIDRLGLLLMPPKYQPDHNYLRHVPLNRVHLFTIIQVVGLVLLWVIKSTPASLIFPLMVLALVGLRKLMDYFPRVFSQNDLKWLDNLMPDSGKKKKNMDSESEIGQKAMDDRAIGFEEGRNGNAVVVDVKRAYNGEVKSVSIDLDAAKEHLLNGKDSQM
ncbi:electrogenic sodium bicarbonate cotransporter 1-like [Tigriopus californicus]|uniref:electrogenic sodium bicarbonate cotransporter 1-like n=1 Tax=Tigriopus californicus TaxID=6832 RepID=UPI0027DA7F2B|nr:electrogenic sodium bicarbonate cotransporter 1-like [Tigriopus californicus]